MWKKTKPTEPHPAKSAAGATATYCPSTSDNKHVWYSGGTKRVCEKCGYQQGD